MKVGLVVPGFSEDANDWCIPALRDLAARLAPSVDLHIFTLRYPYRPARYQLFGAQVTALGGADARGAKTASVWRRAWSAVLDDHHRQHFDLLHAFWAGEPGFLTALLGLTLRVPTMVSVAGGELARLPDLDYGGLLRVRERIKTRIALRLADVVTAGSQLTLASARAWLGSKPARRARRMPLGVDLARFTVSGPQRRNRRPRLLQVASLSPVKDQRTLLLAGAALRRRGYDFELDVVGDGTLAAEVRALASRLSLDGIVRWRGQIAHDRLAPVYRAADVFVLSSRHEAQSMVVLEAAACGLPIVGSAVGVVPEFAPNAARLAPVADADRLADGIGEFLDDDLGRSRAGALGRDLVEGDFVLDTCAGRFLDLYASLVAERRAAAVPGVAG